MLMVYKLVYTELYLFQNPVALLFVVVITGPFEGFENITEKSFLPQFSDQLRISQAKKEKQHWNGQRAVRMRISAGKLV